MIIRSHSLSIGIVGLPNAGKSTLFNSLTKNAVPAENFPFCTIDKNIGIVKIPDPRLDSMAQFFKAEKVVPSAITFVDIAGLVKGASKGEGLGNKFLSHIREVDVIMYVLRAFTGDKIVHVYDRVNPYEDYRIVQSELILKDIETVDKRLNELRKTARAGMTPQLQLQIGVLERLMEWFSQEKPAIEMAMNPEEKEFVHELWLLTNKKRVFVLNVREGIGEAQLQSWIDKLGESMASQDRRFIVKADVKLIGELSEMNEAEKKNYLDLLETKATLVEDLITKAYEVLDLITFYTGSEKEVNAWTINNGATIKEAAGVIHTDLGDNFITADVVNVEDLVKNGGWAKCKDLGLIKNQGKEYLIRDGDYINVYAGNKL